LAVAPARGQDVQVRPDLERLFKEAGTAGTIIVHAYTTDTYFVAGKDRAERPYSPSSTFKIPNTLLALRLGVVSGMDESFAPFDTPFLVRGKPFLPDVCNGRVTLTVALQNSCIPVYQDIAGRIGVARYNEFLVRMNYAPPSVTDANLKTFWLTGAITLSARDQVAFLDRMISGRLPFQTAHIDAMWAALVAGEGEKGVMFAKSGYVFTSTPEVGWYVGWVRKDGQATATFALNLDMTTPEHVRARREITLKALRALDLW
jgi:beta-lactamase class D